MPKRGRKKNQARQYQPWKYIQCPNCSATKISEVCRNLQLKLFDKIDKKIYEIYFCNSCDHYIKLG